MVNGYTVGQGFIEIYDRRNNNRVAIFRFDEICKRWSTDENQVADLRVQQDGNALVVYVVYDDPIVETREQAFERDPELMAQLTREAEAAGTTLPESVVVFLHTDIAMFTADDHGYRMFVQPPAAHPYDTDEQFGEDSGAPKGS